MRLSLVNVTMPLAKLGVAGLSGPTPADHAPETAFDSLAPIVLTFAVLGMSLVRGRPCSRVGRRAAALEAAPFNGLQWLHSGLVVDYVAWFALGLAAIAVACL